MSTTTNAAIAEQYHDDDQPNADAELRLAIECATCGAILPLDTIAPTDRDLIECPRCHRVERIAEVFSR